MFHVQEIIHILVSPYLSIGIGLSYRTVHTIGQWAVSEPSQFHVWIINKINMNTLLDIHWLSVLKVCLNVYLEAIIYKLKLYFYSFLFI